MTAVRCDAQHGGSPVNALPSRRPAHYAMLRGNKTVLRQLGCDKINAAHSGNLFIRWHGGAHSMYHFGVGAPRVKRQNPPA